MERGRIHPRFLEVADHRWLAALLEERQRFAGRPRKEWEARIHLPLPEPAPVGKLLLATRVLQRFEQRAPPPLLPRSIRAAVFRAAAGSAASREEVVSRTAQTLGLTPALLESLLFSDLAAERVAPQLEAGVSAERLAARTNLELAQGFLARAERVRVETSGDAGALLRYTHRRGLIAVSAGPAGLEISGPFRLFRHTGLYGRALADLLPFLVAEGPFRLEASCVLPAGPASLLLATGDPPLPLSPVPRRVEGRRRLLAGLRREGLSGEVDPPPLMVAGSLLFPQLAFERGGHRWLVEMIGFWTTDHLLRHLSHLQASGVHHLLVCCDQERNCGRQDPPDHPALVLYRRRLDPAPLLRAVARMEGGAPSSPGVRGSAREEPA